MERKMQRLLWLIRASWVEQNAQKRCQMRPLLKSWQQIIDNSICRNKSITRLSPFILHNHFQKTLIKVHLVRLKYLSLVYQAKMSHTKGRRNLKIANPKTMLNKYRTQKLKHRHMLMLDWQKRGLWNLDHRHNTVQLILAQHHN